MIESPSTQLHEHNLSHLHGKETVRFARESGPDDQDHQAETDQVQIIGAFRFSTAVNPRDPAKGWCIGTGRRK